MVVSVAPSAEKRRRVASAVSAARFWRSKKRAPNRTMRDSLSSIAWRIASMPAPWNSSMPTRASGLAEAQSAPEPMRLGVSSSAKPVSQGVGWAVRNSDCR